MNILWCYILYINRIYKVFTVCNILCLRLWVMSRSAVLNYKKKLNKTSKSSEFHRRYYTGLRQSFQELFIYAIHNCDSKTYNAICLYFISAHSDIPRAAESIHSCSDDTQSISYRRGMFYLISLQKEVVTHWYKYRLR